MNSNNKLITNKKYLSVLIPALLASSSLSLQAAEQEDKTHSLEVITVTSQKRIQNLQEVPIAVTAVTGETLTSEAIKDIYDLQASVPGLGVFQSQSATHASFSIRGVGTSPQNYGLESSVGLYVDGVYRSRQNAMINNYVDVDAVEVLRGPQGTLFGKNTPMGAINIRTVAPSHGDRNGFLEFTAGNYGLLSFSGASSFTAVEDLLTFRVTGFGSQRDGTVSDIEFGEDVLNDRNRFGGRLQALYTPSDDLTVRIVADYSEIDEICCGANPTTNNFQASGIPGKFGSDTLLSSPLFNATIIKSADFDERMTAFSFLPESTMDDSGLSAEITWDISDTLSFTSLSAYRQFNSFDHTEGDFTNLNMLDKTNDAEQNSISQELRLDYSGEKLHVIGGLYYFSQNLDVDGILHVGDDFNNYVLNGALQGGLNGVIQGINQISALTGGAIAPAASAAPGDTNFSAYSEQKHKSYAVFGQVDYKLSDELTITAGLRYTDENKKLSNTFTEHYASGAIHPTDITSIGNRADPETIVPGSLLYSAGAAGAALQMIQAGVITPGTPAFGQAVQTFQPFQKEGWAFQSLAPATSSRPDIQDSLDDEQVTGTFKLAYQPNDDTLIYASYGTGYKSGGTNTDNIDESFDPIFDAETSQSFEVGLKKDFPDQALRLNIAAHQTKVEDFQQASYTGTGFNLQNAGDYDTSGVEVEGVWLPTDTLTVSLAYAFTQAEYETFDKGNCWIVTPWHTGITPPGLENPDDPFCDQAGNKPVLQPENTLLLQLSQEFEFTNSIYGTASIDYNYRDDFYSETGNDPLSKVDSSRLINARVLVTFDDYDFNLLFWGRNITDETTKGSGIPATLQPGKMINFYTEPATYGVTFRTTF
ncbi:TonB-dependent receptor [Colwellia demingiae]|uniref:TonB-dependent receptor n=1 Tax=Colwellia demingiae TaxID=89401 RepID=A0A5C6QHL2_9GAMM|nr:TonB-dependent receptor [Colwellia demingiae]TWX68082.1 TonB-dependent receptor [Colwellia demingiae]